MEISLLVLLCCMDFTLAADPLLTGRTDADLTEDGALLRGAIRRQSRELPFIVQNRFHGHGTPCGKGLKF